MIRLPLSALFAILVAAVGSPARAAEPSTPVPLERQLALLLEWFPGEWDNHEQHWRHRTVEQREKPHEWIHHVFRPVSVPAIGEHAFFVRQTFGDQPDRVYRQRLYRFAPDPDRNAVRLSIYTFRDEAKYADAWRDPSVLDGLAADELETRPGCDVYWRLDPSGGSFTGSMDEGACRFHSPRLGREIVIHDDLRLTPEELWIRDVATDLDGNRVFGDPDAEHHRNRRVRYYTGWAAIKRGGPEAPAESRDWIGMRDILMHNEGDRVRVVDGDGNPFGYTIELARLTYQNTQIPILKLGVIDEATGRTIAYTWNEPDGRRLGINLGWFQAGVTLKAENPHQRW
jgi:hypothetical protein